MLRSGAHCNYHCNVDGKCDVDCPSVLVCHMSNQHVRDDFRCLTYVTGKHSCPKALVSPRGKGLYFPRTCNDQVRYQCDGLYVVIHIREDGVFYLVCGEPRRMLGHLICSWNILHFSNKCLISMMKMDTELTET